MQGYYYFLIRKLKKCAFKIFAVLFANQSCFMLKEISLKADTRGMVLQNKNHMIFPLDFLLLLFQFVLFIYFLAQLWIIEASGKNP